jgi:hypothetical protein
MYLSHRFVPVNYESALYGLFLIPIACFYLAFASYFGETTAWSLETVAVLAFVVLGSLGTRLPIELISGYALHGVWDLLHEIHAHAGADVFGGRESTQIPLAHGAFFSTYDLAMAAYFIFRRRHWSARLDCEGNAMEAIPRWLPRSRVIA